MNRRSWPLLSLLLAFLLLPLAHMAGADDQSRAREDRIAGRVQEWVDQELSRFREDLLATLRKELHGASTKAAPTAGAGLKDALSAIQAEEIFSYDAWLASDDRHGRESGLQGANDAAEYVREHFEEDGLTPIGDDGTWYQHFTIGRTNKLVAQNVVGMLEGTDRKDEFVVIGAHYDHVGQGKPTLFNGRMGGPKDHDIYNGADDNASGTSGLMEIAKAFSKRMHPSRSIIFIAFSGEEKGLLGSYHYTAHPLRPLEKTVAMINMDMIGRNPGKAVQVLGTQTSPQLAEFAKEAADQVGAKVSFPTSGVFGGSDHYPFYQKGLPVLFYFSGFHKDYHHATDTSDKISHEQLERCARMAAIAVWDAANTDEKIEFKKLPRVAAQKPRLGVTPGEVDEDQLKELSLPKGTTGILIQDVVKGSAAEAGGIEKGDIVVQFDGKTISEDDGEQGFRDLIQAAKKDTDLPVVVVRDGKRVELTVRLK